MEVSEVSSRYELLPLLPNEVARWDELITRYESCELFHRKAWLDYLAASRGLEIPLWAIRGNSDTVGYFCGGVLRKGPFRILGSPLKSWGTNFLGPLVNRDIDQMAFLKALDDLAERERFAMVELENPLLGDDLMERAGYRPVAQPTYVVSLTPGDTQVMWRRIDLKSRQKVRKAKRARLIVEETDDIGLTDEFFDQFVEVLSRKNLFPPYDRNCPRLLFQHLRPQGLLIALRVSEPSGRTVATGLFPHDEKTLYFWGGASRMDSWNYSPNDLLQWTVMEMASRRGLIVYNMCGFGYFKSKFGGTLQSPKRWHKCYWRTARWARHGYEFYFQKRIRLRGWWEHTVNS
jgi:CelD/BcsL family acetyltransferase involved in cellulose biosynthesis